MLAAHAGSKQTDTANGFSISGEIHLEPATVTEVLSGGAAYQVKPAEGDEQTVGGHQVTAPL